MTAQNKDGWTPLRLASKKGQVEVAVMLIERGAGTTPHKYGWTPLHLASLNGQVELVSMLIERGADVTAQNNGLTPLHLAADVRAQNDHVSMIPLPFHLAS